jgi:hypothetical protein
VVVVLQRCGDGSPWQRSFFFALRAEVHGHEDSFQDGHVKKHYSADAAVAAVHDHVLDGDTVGLYYWIKKTAAETICLDGAVIHLM